jgi:outer membrane receptor for monomeric catechols
VRTCVGDDQNYRLRPECLQASMGNTREEGKQEVKGDESGLNQNWHWYWQMIPIYTSY